MENHKKSNAGIIKSISGKLPGMAIVAFVLFVDTHLYAEKLSSDPDYMASFLNQSGKNSDSETNSLETKDLQPVIVTTPEGYHVQINDGDITVFSSLEGGAGLLIVQPSGTTPVSFRGKSKQ